MTNQLFFLSLADIFSVYPTIFNELISSREKPTKVFVPSDGDWQEKMYYRLLEVQKKVNEAVDSGVAFEEVTRRKDKPVFDPARIIQKLSPSTSPNGLRYDSRRKCYLTGGKIVSKPNAFWSLDNIAKAAKLLRKPPISVQFQNEHEMRKVYSLIYDVFRYKVVLSNALSDIAFYGSFPEHKNDQNRIWLMLYELFDRHFKKRNSEEIDNQINLYREADVKDIAHSLWQCRIRLAASISRMRVRFGALSLSQLLPIHLQNEKVAIAASNPVVTGWINPFLLKDKTTTNEFLMKMGFEVQSNDVEEPLMMNQCKWDNICPLFISCIPEDRGEFTKSPLMTKHYFIMQDRTFSYGPAIMSSLLEYFELDGDILQTHIASPRSTAYLASLFYSVNRVNNFYVYGAGSSLKEYRKYMESLGITNIRLFAESFTSFPIESNRFGTVVGVLANAPNSFSAISDPIDLICSRGGDLSMLEVLTESEISDDGKHRVSLILEEQLLTLQKAMSRPHIQFILYLTHSIVQAENQDMVKYAIDLINQTSLEKHRCAFREKKRLEALAELEAANIPSAAMNVSSPRKRNADDKSKSQSNCEADADSAPGDKQELEDSEENVKLPEIDEFMNEAIPDICMNQDNCLKLHSSGCFLSLLRRKSITRLNAKYLIKMAESRGLFGKGDRSKSSKPRAMKAQDTNVDKTGDDPFAKQTTATVNIDTLITRLMQPTNASFIRSNLDMASMHTNRPLIFNFRRRECSRYLMSSILKLSKSAQRSKYWWHYAFFKCINRTETTHQMWGCLKAKSNDNARIRFKLKKYERPPFPIHIHEIKMFCNVQRLK